MPHILPRTAAGVQWKLGKDSLCKNPPKTVKSSAMKLAFTTLGCPNWDLSTLARRAVEYGYDGVDFRGYLADMDLRKSTLFLPGEIQRTARTLRNAGLSVSALSSSARVFDAAPDARAESLGEIEAHIEMAREMGAGTVRVFGGALNGTPPGDALSVAAETLCHAAEIARGAGVVVAVETHDDWVSTPLLARLFERAGFPESAGILWDVHHPFRTAGEAPETTFANIGKNVCYTHWKDSATDATGGHALCRFGWGDLPLKKIFDVLDNNGYDGWHTFEWEKRWVPGLPEPEDAFPDFVRVMRAFK